MNNKYNAYVYIYIFGLKYSFKGLIIILLLISNLR